VLLLVVDWFPRASVPGSVFARVVFWAVVLGDSAVQVVRMADVAFVGRNALDNVNEIPPEQSIGAATSRSNGIGP